MSIEAVQELDVHMSDRGVVAHPGANDGPVCRRPGLIAGGWPPRAFPNGVVTYVQHMLTGLRACGAEPIVLTPSLRPLEPGDDPAIHLDPNPAGLFERIGDRVHWTRGKGAWDERRLARSLHRALAGPLRDAPPDVLEIEESAGTAYSFATTSSVPVVVRLHGPHFLVGAAYGLPSNEAFQRRVAAEKRLLMHAHGITSPSRDVLERTRAHYGLPLDHARVIPNPCPAVDPSRRWHRDGVEGPVVLFVGRFDRVKGGDVVIDAFARVAASRPDARLWFVGPDAGVMTGDGRRIHLADYAGERLKPEQWTNHGFLPAQEVQALRTRAAVTIVASRYENFPMALLEAMAYGCPVVAARAGGMPEIATHDEHALLFEPGDAADAARKIEELLGNGEFSARLGAAAAKHVETSFSPIQVGEKMLEYYDGVLRMAKNRVRSGPR